MEYEILKTYLNSPTKFNDKLKDCILNLKEAIKKEYNIDFDNTELGELVLSVCRVNDYKVLTSRKNKILLNVQNILDWIKDKLLPNTIILNLEDEDILRLLIFCIEITYQMFSGGTRATVTQKGFRERRRTFESILVDQFIGKLGEVIIKKFIEKNFHTKIELDWEISTQIGKYRNDIINAHKNISIKTSPTLAGIWAEADVGYDYGIFVKCSVPQPTILQFFIEVCGFTRLLDFVNSKIPSSDIRFKSYIEEMRGRIKDYKCGEIHTKLKGFICGFFKTSDYMPLKVGKKLPYLGEIREERYIIPINELKYKKEDWIKFLKENNLI